MIQKIVLYLMTDKCYAKEKDDGKEGQNFSPWIRWLTTATTMMQQHHHLFSAV